MGIEFVENEVALEQEINTMKTRRLKALPWDKRTRTGHFGFFCDYHHVRLSTKRSEKGNEKAVKGKYFPLRRKSFALSEPIWSKLLFYKYFIYYPSHLSKFD